MTTPVRVALYLRVSTGRQADSDLSIPDQRRQAKRYCEEHGWEIVADHVEPGMSATDDRRRPAVTAGRWRHGVSCCAIIMRATSAGGSSRRTSR
jgi:Resolvase, N terminal domain